MIPLLCTAAALLLIGCVLFECLEVVVQPRRITRSLRTTRLYYRLAWLAWRAATPLVPGPRRQASYLSFFGPVSLLGLFTVWALALIGSFALLAWAHQLPVQGGGESGPAPFGTYFYLSGVTFFTLGYGDVILASTPGRALAVIEAGVGFGYLAIVIGYFPVLSQACSAREQAISLLDARAGSPPSVAQLLVRMGHAHEVSALPAALAEWERWAASVLEAHLSFPVLAYYRSQHDNQSWVAALTFILDACTVVLAGLEGVPTYQAQLTFAMTRHAAVDLALVYRVPPLPPGADRLAPERLARLRAVLREAGVVLPEGERVDGKIAELRALYEPFVEGLACRFALSLPPFLPEQPGVDNWQTTAWKRQAGALTTLPVRHPSDDHFA